MKHTKQNIIKLLEAIRLNNIEASNIYERNNKFETSLECLLTATFILEIINIIKDKETFEKACLMFNVKGE